MNNKNLTKKITLCGVFAALATVLLYIGGMTLLDMTVLVVCSLMTMILVVETDVRMAWIYTAVTSVLALILMPSKLYAISYVLFSALFPILKMYLERLPALFAFFVKVSVLEVMFIITILLVKFVFTSVDGWFALDFITIIGGIVFFILYDMCLTSVITFYMVKLRKRFRVNK